jgi:hypothetical protein
MLQITLTQDTEFERLVTGYYAPAHAEPTAPWDERVNPRVRGLGQDRSYRPPGMTEVGGH